MMIFGPLFMILVLAVVIAAAVLLVRWLGGPWHSVQPPYHMPAARTPLDILKERYARGETIRRSSRSVVALSATELLQHELLKVPMKILLILNDPPYGTERCTTDYGSPVRW